MNVLFFLCIIIKYIDATEYVELSIIGSMLNITIVNTLKLHIVDAVKIININHKPLII